MDLGSFSPSGGFTLVIVSVCADFWVPPVFGDNKVPLNLGTKSSANFGHAVLPCTGADKEYSVATLLNKRIVFYLKVIRGKFFFALNLSLSLMVKILRMSQFVFTWMYPDKKLSALQAKVLLYKCKFDCNKFPNNPTSWLKCLGGRNHWRIYKEP